MIASSSSSSSMSMSLISSSLELSDRSCFKPSDSESLYLSPRSRLPFFSRSRSWSRPYLSRSLRPREYDLDLLWRSFRSLFFKYKKLLTQQFYKNYSIIPSNYSYLPRPKLRDLLGLRDLSLLSRFLRMSRRSRLLSRCRSLLSLRSRLRLSRLRCRSRLLCRSRLEGRSRIVWTSRLFSCLSECKSLAFESWFGRELELLFSASRFFSSSLLLYIKTVNHWCLSWN